DGPDQSFFRRPRSDRFARRLETHDFARGVALDFAELRRRPNDDRTDLQKPKPEFSQGGQGRQARIEPATQADSRSQLEPVSFDRQPRIGLHVPHPLDHAPAQRRARQEAHRPQCDRSSGLGSQSQQRRAKDRLVSPIGHRKSDAKPVKRTKLSGPLAGDPVYRNRKADRRLTGRSELSAASMNGPPKLRCMSRLRSREAASRRVLSSLPSNIESKPHGKNACSLLN